MLCRDELDQLMSYTHLPFPYFLPRMMGIEHGVGGIGLSVFRDTAGVQSELFGLGTERGTGFSYIVTPDLVEFLWNPAMTNLVTLSTWGCCIM